MNKYEWSAKILVEIKAALKAGQIDYLHHMEILQLSENQFCFRCLIDTMDQKEDVGNSVVQNDA